MTDGGALLRWDIFCRVIDNHGDLGTCWRLASQLAARGQRCRLWVDDASALSWMAPTTQPVGGARPPEAIDGLPRGLRARGRVIVGAFDDAAAAEPGDVVIEAFGCDPPPAFVERMRTAVPPVWINLEYLSAQGYVDRSHGLPSPQAAGPGAGPSAGRGSALTKWFFFPGFTPTSGGLLRGPQAALAPQLPLRKDERAVLVFAYGHARLRPLLDALDVEPTLVLAAPGPSLALVEGLFRDDGRGRHLRLHRLPWLDQPTFDALLCACDLSVVRGEDSLVQALWAGRPFVWNIYAQDDGAHEAKLDALLDRMLDGVDAHTGRDVRRVFRGVNGVAAGDEPLPPLDSARLASWRAAITPWLERLRAQEDLVTRLVAFVARQRRMASNDGSPR